MKLEDFAYVVETEKSFEQAVTPVLKSAEQKGGVLFQIYDIKERLAAKGFEQKPLKIIEICKAKHANNFLNKNHRNPTTLDYRPEFARNFVARVGFLGYQKKITPFYSPHYRTELSFS